MQLTDIPERMEYESINCNYFDKFQVFDYKKRNDNKCKIIYIYI